MDIGRIYWLTISVLYICWNYYSKSFYGWFAIDFNIYYYFAHTGERELWYYKDWLSFIWLIFTSFEFWYILCSLFVLRLIDKLLELRHGWLLVLPFCKIAGWNLASGNIQSILATLCLTPFGCLVAGMVKPQLLSIMVFHAIARCYSKVQH